MVVENPGVGGSRARKCKPLGNLELIAQSRDLIRHRQRTTVGRRFVIIEVARTTLPNQLPCTEIACCMLR